jgi:hypothetical protein
MPTPTEPGRWVIRLLLCLATALTVSATAYLCAWATHRNMYTRTENHVLTRNDLELLREDVERHKEATGKWPERLTDLPVVKEKRVPVDAAGNPLDRWRRPFIYRIQEGRYVLFSYGADDKPGGLGKYADLYAGEDDSWPERPDLWQFSTLREAIPVQVACILAGVIAFPICLLEARGKAGQRRPSLGKFLLGSAVTAVFAILAAMMMSALHLIPGGH